ncbi:fatty acid alpha-hydroxylase [Haplosporangium sp. Z 767]|nr:fatty acid alpha-hydroxylase [Haplosporangium sp. Z 767]KAF9192913.1 fatty acid alpha-hydroxylase [Haplosporangium sp. Z 11]
MSKVYSLTEVAMHNTVDDCWVIHDNKVYDVSAFVPDHPGGEEFILDHAGTDITALMKDELEHLHSEGAYDMLDELLIGHLESSTSASPDLTPSGVQKRANAKSKSSDDEDEYTEDFFKPTDLVADKKQKFLDLNQPLLWQLWRNNYSKAFYLEQVHIPRHLSGPARIFGSSFLEFFTKTPWYVVPIFWLPIVAYNVYRGLEAGLTNQESGIFFLCGVFLWTLAEYVIHRFLFHLDDLLPDSTFWLIAHFLLHGIHHYVPMDRLRLVMPPVLAIALATPLNQLAHTLLPKAQAYGVFGGLLFGYILYDMVHYYLHHARVFKIHFKRMKTYHLAHHYKNYEAGYGITSVFFDKLFGTELKL